MKKLRFFVFCVSAIALMFSACVFVYDLALMALGSPIDPTFKWSVIVMLISGILTTVTWDN